MPLKTWTRYVITKGETIKKRYHLYENNGQSIENLPAFIINILLASTICVDRYLKFKFLNMVIFEDNIIFIKTMWLRGGVLGPSYYRTTFWFLEQETTFWLFAHNAITFSHYFQRNKHNRYPVLTRKTQGNIKVWRSLSRSQLLAPQKIGWHSTCETNPDCISSPEELTIHWPEIRRKHFAFKRGEGNMQMLCWTPDMGLHQSPT